MARSYRKEKLNERIKELLGELLLNRVKDPRVGLVTITMVTVAPDLATAKVYFTVMGDEAVRAETRKGLESASSYLRKTVAGELKLRQTPELRFVYDDTLDRAMRIDETIEGLRRNEKTNEEE
jgi:ribosome-binding factor A